jgi:hypothetical protein
MDLVGRSVVLTIAVALVFGVAGVSLQSAAEAQTGASRIFDRTLLCQTGLQAGQRELYVFGSSGFRFVDNPSRWQRLAQVGLTSPSPQGGVYVGVRAGSPRPPFDQPYSDESSLSLGVGRCRATRVAVPLSPRGLGGGVANKVGENYECYPPRHVLVRVWAVFAAPASPRPRDGVLFASVPMKEGRVAVRTKTGKPLVYGEAFENGRARVFIAGDCLRP